MKCNLCGMPITKLRGTNTFICIDCNNIQEYEDE